MSPRRRAGLLFFPVVALAAALRLPDLAARPMHADEAVHADKLATLLEGGGYGFVSGIGAESHASGAGGQVVIAAPTFEVRDGAVVTAQAFSTGQAGSIRVTAADTLVVADGASIATRTTQSDGGNIAIEGRGVVQLTGVGDFRHPAMTLPLEVTIDSTGRSAVVSLRPWQLREAPAAVSVHGDTVDLSVPADGETARFRGAVHDAIWVREARRGEEPVPIELHHVLPMTGPEWERVFGTYRAADGRLLAVSHFQEFGEHPMLMDFGTGRVGPLLPIGRDRLLV